MLNIKMQLNQLFLLLMITLGGLGCLGTTSEPGFSSPAGLEQPSEAENLPIEAPAIDSETSPHSSTPMPFWKKAFANIGKCTLGMLAGGIATGLTAHLVGNSLLGFIKNDNESRLYPHGYVSKRNSTSAGWEKDTWMVLFHTLEEVKEEWEKERFGVYLRKFYLPITRQETIVLERGRTFIEYGNWTWNRDIRPIESIPGYITLLGAVAGCPTLLKLWK